MVEKVDEGIGYYFQHVETALEKAQSFPKKHFDTEQADVYLTRSSNNLLIEVCFGNMKNIGLDDRVNVYYAEDLITGDVDLRVEHREGEHTIQLAPSLVESGETYYRKHLKRIFLALNLTYNNHHLDKRY